MKVQFYCDNGANIHSERTEEFDLEKDLHITPDEWNELSEEAKYQLVYEWMIERLEYGFRELT